MNKVEKQRIEQFFEERDVEYVINEDGTVDIKGDVEIDLDDLYNDYLPFTFGKVTGNFMCGEIGLISLEGSPYHVDGDFVCNYNDLDSLEGRPHYVGGDFICNDNDLEDLDDCPEYVGGKIISDFDED